MLAALVALAPALASASCAVPAGLPARQVLFTSDVYGANAGGKLQLLEGEPPAVRKLAIDTGERGPEPANRAPRLSPFPGGERRAPAAGSDARGDPPPAGLWTNGEWDDGNMTLTTVATTLDAHMVGPAVDTQRGVAYFITRACEVAERRRLTMMSRNRFGKVVYHSGTQILPNSASVSVNCSNDSYVYSLNRLHLANRSFDLLYSDVREIVPRYSRDADAAEI